MTPISAAEGVTATDAQSDVAEIDCSGSSSGIVISIPTPFGHTMSRSVIIGIDGIYTLHCTATDVAGNTSDPAKYTLKLDAAAPTVVWPATMPTFTLNQADATVTATVSDTTSGVLSASVSATVSTAGVGIQSVTLTGQDVAGNTTTVSCAYEVVYPFSGFLPPISNPPTLNLVTAGRTISINFSLGRDYGLDVVTSVGSQNISCDASPSTNPIEDSDTSGNSGLHYDATNNQYT